MTVSAGSRLGPYLGPYEVVSRLGGRQRRGEPTDVNVIQNWQDELKRRVPGS